MTPSYENITETFTCEFHPGTSGGGTSFLLDLTLGPVWNGLMSKDSDGFGPIRVVSAWRAFRDGCSEDDGYDEWHRVVKACVKNDLGKGLLADCIYEKAYRRYWSFAVLYQTYGENWPTKAIAARLRKIEGESRADARAMAEVVWERALKVYAAHKASVEAANAVMEAA
jgi:hypothetical protein